MDTAEVKQGEQWGVVGIEAAKRLRDKLMRCEACHGPVYLMQDYTSERKSAFRHRRTFAGCGGNRGGVPLRHPTPLA
jgi:hypothetical protein